MKDARLIANIANTIRNGLADELKNDSRLIESLTLAVFRQQRSPLQLFPIVGQSDVAVYTTEGVLIGEILTAEDLDELLKSLSLSLSEVYGSSAHRFNSLLNEVILMRAMSASVPEFDLFTLLNN